MWGGVPKTCPPIASYYLPIIPLALQKGVFFHFYKTTTKTSIKLRFCCTQWFYKTTTKSTKIVLKTSVAAYVDVWVPPVGSICCHNPLPPSTPPIPPEWPLLWNPSCWLKASPAKTTCFPSNRLFAFTSPSCRCRIFLPFYSWRIPINMWLIVKGAF